MYSKTIDHELISNTTANLWSRTKKTREKYQPWVWRNGQGMNWAFPNNELYAPDTDFWPGSLKRRQFWIIRTHWLTGSNPAGYGAAIVLFVLSCERTGLAMDRPLPDRVPLIILNESFPVAVIYEQV